MALCGVTASSKPAADLGFRCALRSQSSARDPADCCCRSFCTRRAAGIARADLLERTGSTEAIDRYSQRCLRLAWKAVRFSWWFTTLTHKFSDDPFSHRLQPAELDYLTGSQAALTSAAENYVGLPFENAP